MKEDELISYGELETIGDIEPLKMRLKLSLQRAVERVNAKPEVADQIAYELAGFLALDLVRQMSVDDPYRLVLELAGQLELPKRHQEAEASWWRLEQLVRDLPD